jgi:hypothetical protein
MVAMQYRLSPDRSDDCGHFTYFLPKVKDDRPGMVGAVPYYTDLNFRHTREFSIKGLTLADDLIRMEGIPVTPDNVVEVAEKKIGPSKGETMFKGRISLKWAFVVVGLLMPVMAHAASAPPATVTITATVDGFAEWASTTPAIVAADWTGHITQASQSRTVSLANTLYTNVDTTITPTAGTNSGILTNGSQTLITEYQITGNVNTPDVAYKAAAAGAGQFFDVANTYALTHVPGTGTYTVNLLARMTSGAVAPDAGDYTCTVVLTASW